MHLRCNRAFTSAQLSVRHSNYRLYRLGCQGVELYYSRSGWSAGIPRNPQNASCGANYDPAFNKERAERRARSQIRRLILAHNLSYMWSFTFSGEVTDIDEAWKQFRLFYRRLHRHHPDLKYVVVPELQKRGVWHFHMCIDQYIDHGWMSQVWGQGFVFVSTGDASGASRYLCKYISKSFDDCPTGEHRYKRSRNMSIEMIEGQDKDFENIWSQVEEIMGGAVAPAFVFHDPTGDSLFAIVTPDGVETVERRREDDSGIIQRYSHGIRELEEEGRYAV